jgi:phage major head subunit gpT-like protein
MATQVLSQREVVGMFYKALEQGAHPWAGDLAFRNPGANQGVGTAEQYKWLGQSPTPREFVGGRQPHQLRQAGYEITNKRWEASIEVPLLDWTHDKTGQIQVRVRELASRYGAHIARLISTLMIAGESTACYDGQFFFDTEHAEGDSGTQSNDLSVDIAALPVTNHGSTTAPSPAEAAHCVMQAVSAILGFKDDRGEPMNEEASDFRVIVPTPLWMRFAAAVGAKVLDGGDDNPVAIGSMDGYRVRVHMNPRLSWTTKAAVFRADGNVKPFIYQEDGSGGSGVNMKILGPESEYATINDSCLVTTDAINNAGYGYWQHGCLVTMA